MRKTTLLLTILFVVLTAGLAQANYPQRIVSLAPSITENLFALGVGDRVVGVTSWCNYPEEAAAKTVIGDAFNINLELILSLEPDLIIGDPSVVASHIEQISGLNISVLEMEPTNIEEIRESLIKLGEILGVQDQAMQVVQSMDQRLKNLLSIAKRQRPVRVYLEIWNEPYMTVGPGSFMHEILTLAGGENIATDTNTPWPMFSEELIIERDPEVIILTSFNLDEALTRSAWQNIAAFKQANVFQVDPDIYTRATPRILDALEEVISLLDHAE